MGRRRSDGDGRLLRALMESRYAGGPEKLAKEAGISRSSIFRYTSGGPITRESALKIIAARGWREPVTLTDLGLAEDPSRDPIGRLEELEARLIEAAKEQTKLMGDVAELQERVQQLEAQRRPARARKASQ